MYRLCSLRSNTHDEVHDDVVAGMFAGGEPRYGKDYYISLLRLLRRVWEIEQRKADEQQEHSNSTKEGLQPAPATQPSNCMYQTAD